MDRIKNIEKALRKSLLFNSKPTYEDFPELIDICIWIRCILACMYGHYLGTHNIRSAVQLVQCLNFITFLPVVYAGVYLQIDKESYGNKVLFAGVVNAMAMAVLVWILFFTMEHAAEESIMKDLMMSDGDGAAIEEDAQQVPMDEGGTIEETVSADHIVDEEPEF